MGGDTRSDCKMEAGKKVGIYDFILLIGVWVRNRGSGTWDGSEVYDQCIILLPVHRNPSTTGTNHSPLHDIQ